MLGPKWFAAVGRIGALYGSDAARAVFGETTCFQRMLDTEAAFALVQARLGIIPEAAAETIAAQVNRMLTNRGQSVAADQRSSGRMLILERGFSLAR